MGDWTSDELDKIAAADELELASAKQDGTRCSTGTKSYVDPMAAEQAQAATIRLVPR